MKVDRDARFYFANLCVDIGRCVKAAEDGNETRYQESLELAYHTLDYLRDVNRPEAYEEGQLLLRGLALARADAALPAFRDSLNALIALSLPVSVRV